MNRLLELVGIQKTLGHRSVLNGADLTIDAGEVVWMVGPNGSGKTTLIKVAAGMSTPGKGTVLWFGNRPSPKGRSRIGVLLDNSFLYGELTAEENLLYYAKIYGLTDARRQVQDWLERVKLHRDKHVLVKAFSKGMKQRLAIARTFLHQPEVLFLDEPYDGLDVASSQLLTSWIKTMREAGTGILLVSHEDATFRDLPLRTVKLAQGRLIKGDSQ